jgi:hypothetical protein
VAIDLDSFAFKLRFVRLLELRTPANGIVQFGIDPELKNGSQPGYPAFQGFGGNALCQFNAKSGEVIRPQCLYGDIPSHRVQ